MSPLSSPSEGRVRGGVGGSLPTRLTYLGSLHRPWPPAPACAAPRGCWRRRTWGAARCPAWPGCGKSGGQREAPGHRGPRTCSALFPLPCPQPSSSTLLARFPLPSQKPPSGRPAWPGPLCAPPAPGSPVPAPPLWASSLGTMCRLHRTVAPHRQGRGCCSQGHVPAQSRAGKLG